MSSSSRIENVTATTSTINNNTNQLDNQLELSGVIGFNGSVPHGLLLHPGDDHIIYPLGSTIVVKHLTANTQHFLRGHDRSVSCLSLSSTGKYLATGQSTHMGFTALVIIWNLETYEPIHRLVLHRGKVQDLAFSPNERFLATLGGRDDNKLVIWDVSTGQSICGATAANESTNTVRWFNNSEFNLVTGGHYNLRVWSFDLTNRKIRPTDCQLGQLKRVINSITIDAEDQYMYASTGTGDLLQINLQHSLFKASGPSKPNKPFQLGLSCTMRTNKGNYVVGSGDGTIALLQKDTFKILRRATVSGGVTSLVLNAAGDHFFVGTSECNIYLVELQSFEMELRSTCHKGRITDIAYPAGFSELFATVSGSDIRVWNSKSKTELLRIQVPNLNCLCVAFMLDGKSIVSGWDDGKIRAFKPQSGKLIYCISDAHIGGVTAIAVTSDSNRIISGGDGGQVRVWLIERTVQRMLASMKEHKGRVSAIKINGDDTECVSASADGSCIVWSLIRFVRNSCLFASTQFKAIVYHPDQSQLLTTGTDRKLTYWDVVDGAPIRIIDGSATDQLCTLSISADGEKFVSGGGDKLVKVWGYDEGYCYYRGIGHSGEITSTAISPDQQSIVSAGDEGAIFIWKMPEIPHLNGSNNGLLSSSRSADPEAEFTNNESKEQIHSSKQYTNKSNGNNINKSTATATKSSQRSRPF